MRTTPRASRLPDDGNLMCAARLAVRLRTSSSPRWLRYTLEGPFRMPLMVLVTCMAHSTLEPNGMCVTVKQDKSESRRKQAT